MSLAPPVHVTVRADWTTRRAELAEYFDRTAHDAWARLTSDAPLGRVRARVREGRDRMRATLLDWLPTDLRGTRVLDAGSGTGALAVALAQRGADVLAIDLSPRLIALAAERLPPDLPGTVRFRSGDMLDGGGESFDHVVAMDSLIHYEAAAMADAVAVLARRARRSVLFTFVPRTTPLALKLAIGHLFPRADRAPEVAPVRPARLRSLLEAASLRPERQLRVSSGFYVSEAMEVAPA